MRWQDHELPDVVDITSPPNQRPLSERLFERAMAEAGRLNEHPSVRGTARAKDSELWDMGLHARYYEGLIEGLTYRLNNEARARDSRGVHGAGRTGDGAAVSGEEARSREEAQGQ